MTKKLLPIPVLLFLFLLNLPVFASQTQRQVSDMERQIVESEIKLTQLDSAFATRYAGTMFLDVENHGRLWYVDPASKNRFYFENGKAALNICAELATGITYEDIQKISVGIPDILYNLQDDDSDGLPDRLEAALGLNPNSDDTDGDGIGDKEELENGYNPVSDEKYHYSQDITKRFEGKMLLQVSGPNSHGEIWYIKNGQRWYGGTEDSMYEIMKGKSLGAKSADIRKIGVGGVTKNINNQFEPNVQTSEIDECTTVSSVYEKNSCYKKSAVLTKDIAVCEMIIDDIARKEECYSDVAIALPNIKTCDKINDFNKRERCYWKTAEATNNIKLCETITDSEVEEGSMKRKDQCYLFFSRETNDSSICEKISFYSQKETCYIDIAWATKDAAMCKKVNNYGQFENFKDNCYANVARETMNIALCDLISDDSSDIKEDCYSNNR